MAFGEEGTIEKMTIAAADLHPLIEVVRAAAQSGAARAREGLFAKTTAAMHHVL